AAPVRGARGVGGGPARRVRGRPARPGDVRREPHSGRAQRLDREPAVRRARRVGRAARRAVAPPGAGPVGPRTRGAGALARRGGPKAVLCAGGLRSSTVISALKRHGIQHWYNVTGGMTAWTKSGYPIARPTTVGPAPAASPGRTMLDCRGLDCPMPVMK